MEIQHVQSLMIYCNFDELQNEFSKTYREFSGMNHNNFYYWGKYLKQSIHRYGTKMVDSDIQSVYHGIGETLLFPQITGELGIGMKIYCPLSTSSSLLVATNFTNNNGGLIIEFGHASCAAKYFPVSWLSDYGNESELLFIQNEHDMQKK
eukprot:530609_1